MRHTSDLDETPVPPKPVSPDEQLETYHELRRVTSKRRKPKLDAGEVRRKRILRAVKVLDRAVKRSGLEAVLAAGFILLAES